ncbi:uncharacterized protein LOC119738875 [Patiria miniata]|uniref:Apple domain-containing protein n=1 Tax=Patiria miniata TaxID=46514 RepID=A0A914B1V7_PATMI|nr:uncharacterized protein LOC119738875 [Patiria miniata]
MLQLCLLIPIYSLVIEALNVGPHCQDKPCIKGCSRGLERYFNGIANHVLPGHVYGNLTVASRVLCGRECLIDDRCFSFHYSEGKRRCELNGATASRYPLALIERTGTNYYGPEQASFANLLTNETEEKGPISLTDCRFYNHPSAASECNKTGQHLCLRWELDHASNEGYPATPPYGSWYADPDSQAVLTETRVTYHDLPLTSPSPGLCCSLPMTYRDPVITPQSYELADRAGQASGCSDLAAHPCTLAELKEAYDRGYRSVDWLYFEIPNRDASVVGCGVYHYGDECYQDTIGNTPRPGAPREVLCCPNRA